ncbi:MAG: outer membrane protein [Pseudomonadota bacterium]
MKKTLFCATAATALVSFGPAAMAQEGWYTRLDIGYSIAGNADYDVATPSVGSLAGNANVGDNFGVWGGAGYDFDNSFRLETTFGYRAGDTDVDPDTNGLPVLGGIQASPLNEDGNAQVWDAMANLLYDVPTQGRVTPYLGVGVGLANVKLSARNLQINGAAVNGFSDSDTSFAYQALAGLGFAVTDNLTLDLGYRWFNVDDLDFVGTDANGGAVAYTGDYQDHTLTAGLRYKFGVTRVTPNL